MTMKVGSEGGKRKVQEQQQLRISLLYHLSTFYSLHHFTSSFLFQQILWIWEGITFLLVTREKDEKDGGRKKTGQGTNLYFHSFHRLPKKREKKMDRKKDVFLPFKR